jgi:hypothetical protein
MKPLEFSLLPFERRPRMNRILMFALLAIFALLVAISMMLVTPCAEIPSHPDAQAQLALEASPDMTLVLVNIGDLSMMVFYEPGRPTRDERLSLGVAIRDLHTTNEATAVERGGRDCI